MKKIMYYNLFVFICFSILSCSGSDGDNPPTLEVDTENPTITCLENITITIESTDPDPVVNYTAPVGTDNINAITTQIEGLSSGSTFPVGTTTNTFKATDAAGNSASCSFDVIVTRNAPSSDLPFIIGSDPKPAGKVWAVVDALTDEFDGTSEQIDLAKWNPNPYTENRFSWIGRFPGLFETENVLVRNGELWMEAEKFDSSKTVSNQDWTHGGAIVRSQELLVPGTFCEARMKTTETIMSGTFWMSTPNANCNSVIKKELDVTESIGIRSFTTKQPVLGWYEPTAVKFRTGINANARQRQTSCLNAVNAPAEAKDAAPEQDFHTYGFFWESPTELHFYYDGEYVFSIDPPTPFNDPMAITMAIEIYDFNYPSNDAESDGFNKTLEERSTRYDYVRTWKLEDE